MPRARTRHGSVEASEKLLLVVERMAKLFYLAEPDLPALAVYNIGCLSAKASSPITTTTGIRWMHYRMSGIDPADRPVCHPEPPAEALILEGETAAGRLTFGGKSLSLPPPFTVSNGNH